MSIGGNGLSRRRSRSSGGRQAKPLPDPEWGRASTASETATLTKGSNVSICGNGLSRRRLPPRTSSRSSGSRQARPQHDPEEGKAHRAAKTRGLVHRQLSPLVSGRAGNGWAHEDRHGPGVSPLRRVEGVAAAHHRVHRDTFYRHVCVSRQCVCVCVCARLYDFVRVPVRAY